MLHITLLRIAVIIWCFIVSFSGYSLFSNLPERFAQPDHTYKYQGEGDRNNVTVRFEFDHLPSSFIIINDSVRAGSSLPPYTHSMNEISPTIFETVIPPTQYSMFISFYAGYHHIVFRDTIEISSDTIINISINEANNLVQTLGVSHTGDSLHLMDLRRFQMNVFNAEYNFYSEFNNLSPVYKISDFSGSFCFSTMQIGGSFGSSPDTIFVVRHKKICELDKDTVLFDQTVEFFEQNIKYRFPNNMFRNWITFNPGMWYDDSNTPIHSGFGRTIMDSTEWLAKLYINPDPDTNHVQSLAVLAKVEESILDDYNFTDYPKFKVKDDLIASYVGMDPQYSDYFSGENDTLYFGYAPIFCNGIHTNNLNNQTTISVQAGFQGPMKEIMEYNREKAYLQVMDIAGSSIYNGRLDSMNVFSVSPGEYVTVITDTIYHVRSKRGLGVLRSNFNLSSSDPNPPLLSSLRVIDKNGKSTESIWNGSGKIQFSAMDYYYGFKDYYGLGMREHIKYKPILNDSTKILIKHHDSTDWINLSFSLIGEDTDGLATEWASHLQFRHYLSFVPTGMFFEAPLDTILLKGFGFYDIKIMLKDSALNGTVWTLSPGFYVRPYYTGIYELEKESHTITLNSFPNPFSDYTNIVYHLSEKADIKLSLLDLSGRLVRELDSGQKNSGIHNLSMERGNLPTGVYLLSLSSKTSHIVRKCIIF